MTLINFTVHYDVLQAVAPSPPGDVVTVALSGTVEFVPKISAPAQSAGYSPRPAGVVLAPVNAVIDVDGQLKDAVGGNVGVRLVACDPVLGLANLPYIVRFSLVDVNAKPVAFPAASFEAPATDTVVNLVNVMPVAWGVSAQVVALGPAGPAGPQGLQGPAGPQGPPGPSSGHVGVVQYNYQANTAPPAANGQFRLNNADPTQATVAYLSAKSLAGGDVSNILSLLDVGGTLTFQDFNSATIYDNYTVAAAMTNSGTYFTVPVTWTGGSGPLNNNQKTPMIVNQLSG
jgi:hypothetical protein